MLVKLIISPLPSEIMTPAATAKYRMRANLRDRHEIGPSSQTNCIDFLREYGAGDEDRTRNFQLGNLIRSAFICNTYKNAQQNRMCIVCMLRCREPYLHLSAGHLRDKSSLLHYGFEPRCLAITQNFQGSVALAVFADRTVSTARHVCRQTVLLL